MGLACSPLHAWPAKRKMFGPSRRAVASQDHKERCLVLHLHFYLVKKKVRDCMWVDDGFSIFFNGRQIIKLRPPHPPIEWFALVSAILLLEWQLLTIKRNAESVHTYSGWRTAVARWHRARHSTKNDRSNKVAMCIAFALCGSASAQRSDGMCEYGVGRTAVDGGQIEIGTSRGEVWCV